MDDTPSASGHGNPKCGAEKRQGEGTCAKPAGWGTDHAGFGRCRLHGGSTPTQRQAAKAERAETQARQVLALLDVTPVDNPFTALSRLAGQAVAWQEALSDQVNRLGEIRFLDAKGGEQLRAEMALYERAMDRCGHVLGLIAKLNIDERLVAISEKQADQVLAAIDAALAHIGVTGLPAAEARRAAARHLRSV